MPALDDDYYSPQMSFEEMAREAERRRQQERYAPPGAPAPMQPSEYVVAQAMVPPPLRRNEIPTGPDPRASPVSALDMQEPGPNLEDIASRGAPVPERYVPQSGAVAPMYPNPPPVATADVPPPVGVVSDKITPIPPAPAPSALNPPEAAVPPPGPLGTPGQQPGVSQETRNILAEHGQPMTPAEPAKEGDFIWTADRGLHRAKGGETGGLNLGQLPDTSDIGFSLDKGLYRKGSSVEVSSSTPETAATPKPAAEAEIPSATTPPVPGRKPAVPPYVVKGATGTPKSATAAPEAPPNATPKASIDPTFLVQLEKSNPALHDQIVQAATAAGVGSWDYANLLYATSKLDPNYNEGGRKGMAGLTDADIASFKNSAYGQAFANADPMNPATNLLMGALKFRESRDEFGPRTPSSILAYRVGVDRTNELSRHTPEQQREHLPPVDMNFVQQAIGGPDAKPGTEPQLKLTDNGTYQPRAAAQALTAAAQAGDPRIYYRYQNDALPRGMTSNDGWRYAEGKMVTGFIRAGDMDGAQKAREMLFQMQHVGANQALMRAHSLLGAGDMVGAAKELALAYWATPDGGQARFSITPQGIIGQRYNEATGQPVGAPIPMDQARIMSMMQLTQDPMAYQKNVREGAKLNAEIADKYADVEQKKAHAEFYRGAPARADVAAETGALRSAALLAGKGAGAGEKVDPRVEHARTEIARIYPFANPYTGEKIQYSPMDSVEQALAYNLILNNDSMATGDAQNIARDLTQNPNGGKFAVAPNTATDASGKLKKPGWGVVFDRTTKAPVSELNPAAMSRLRPAVQAAPPRPPTIGGTPAPAAGR